MEAKQQTIRIIAQTVILSLAGIAVVALLVFGVPLANRLADRLFAVEGDTGLVLNFNGTLDGQGGEKGYGDSLEFVPGYQGKGVLFEGETSLYYLSDDNIRPDRGSLEFWLNPLWDGSDGDSYVFFEIGDQWFNRLRVMKDGANNFRFMVWSSQTEYGAACSVNDWAAGEWHHVQAIWMENTIYLFLDGTHCDSQKFVTMPEELSDLIYIGSSANSDLYAQAVIDELVITTNP